MNERGSPRWPPRGPPLGISSFSDHPTEPGLRSSTARNDHPPGSQTPTLDAPKPRDKLIEPEAQQSFTQAQTRDQTDQRSYNALLSLSPGMGVSLNAGIPSLGGIADLDVADELERILSYEDLAEPPKLMNGNALRMDYPMTRSPRNPTAEAVLEIIIGQDGR